jgi:hypothetical protein
MKNSHILTAVLLFAILFCTNLFGFDGERKGFVLNLGGGLGIASYEQELSDAFYVITFDRENSIAFWTNFKIGYAPNDQFMILYSNVVPWFKMVNIYGDDVTIISGVMGPKVLYFINPYQPSFFFGGGLGLAYWDAPFEDDLDRRTSFGLVLEAGYEFSRSVNVSFHILYGNPSKTESGITAETNFLNFGATINWMGY